MKLFGDDGFRDEFGKGFLQEDFLAKFFYCLNFFFKSHKINNILVGFDTRKSKKKNIKYNF